MAPRVHNVDTRWKWVVSFTSRTLYSGERATGPIV